LGSLTRDGDVEIGQTGKRGRNYYKTEFNFKVHFETIFFQKDWIKVMMINTAQVILC